MTIDRTQMSHRDVYAVVKDSVRDVFPDATKTEICRTTALVIERMGIEPDADLLELIPDAFFAILERN